MISPGFALVLVGLAGKTPIDSLGFDHAEKRFPMSADFSERTNTVVAFAIPVGVKQLSLASIGVRQWSDGKPSYKSGKRVLTQVIDIDRPGLYYTATLDTDNPGELQEAAFPNLLKRFRDAYASSVGHLEPVNFRWPGL